MNVVLKYEYNLPRLLVERLPAPPRVLVGVGDVDADPTLRHHATVLQNNIDHTVGETFCDRLNIQIRLILGRHGEQNVEFHVFATTGDQGLNGRNLIEFNRVAAGPDGRLGGVLAVGVGAKACSFDTRQVEGRGSTITY